MNREQLAAAAPAWIQIEAFPAQTQLDMLAMWVEAIMDAIEHDHLEPDTWEALYLSHAIGALVEGKYFAALSFAEMVLIDPASHRLPRLHPDGPMPVTLADLRDAMTLIRARPARGGEEMSE